MAKSIVEIQGQSEILDSTFSLQNLLNIPGTFPVQSSAIAPETQASLDEAITLAKQYLHNAASRDDFDELLITTFGDRYNPQIAENLRQNFIDGNIENLFQLSNLADNILGDAQGAFAQGTNTIYLADSLLNSHNVEQITNVFLEEFIHGIDSLINPIDAQGDEGDIGSRLIRGETITSDELALLKQENDQATIFLNGQAIAIEQALPTLTLSVIDGTAAEINAGQVANPGTFRFTRTGSTATALTVYYNIAGTAIKGTDYNNLTGSVVIPIGATFVNLAIAPINDAAYEGTEKVTLSLKTSSAYVLGAAQIGTVNILDNDKPTLTITANDASAAEVTAGLTQNPGQFTLTRTGNMASALTAYYTISGTATKGTDYNNLTGTVSFAAGSSKAVVNIAVTNDSITEGNESVVLTLSSNASYTLGLAKSAVVTIVDNDVSSTDINRDGRSDIVGFREDNVWASLSNGNGTFGAAIYAINDFDAEHGWHTFNDQPRMLGDVNGDGRADIVGFREDNVWVSLSNGNGTFGAAIYAINDFDKEHGWISFDKQPRILGDVNGDGRADIVGFREDNVWVSFSNGNGTFTAPIASINDFDKEHGWVSFNSQPRTLADVNGDGRVDIVGFREDNVWVSLGNGNGSFKAPINAINDFDKEHGWISFNNQPRMLGDVNGDDRADIIGFRDDRVWVSLSNGNGTFAAPVASINDFDPEHGWVNFNNQPRMLGDINGDRRVDIIGFREDNVWTSLGTGTGNFNQPINAINNFNQNYGWRTFNKQPLMAGMGGYAPDLIVQNQFAPSSATAGNNVTISANTVNIGSGTAGGSYIRYWLSDDAILNTNTDRYLGQNLVNALNAATSQYGSLTFNYNSAWGTGTKYIFFETDGYNVVTDENSESNNLAYQSISISSIGYKPNIEAVLNSYFDNPANTNGDPSWNNATLQQMWDRIAGESAQFPGSGVYNNGTDGDRWKVDMPPEVYDIYKDLSIAIFGKEVAVNSGYVFDQSYFNGEGLWHSGLDLQGSSGTSIKAAVGGIVHRAQSDYVMINGDDGNLWMYGHLGIKNVSQGQRIEVGQLLGQTDSANHLHLEVQHGHGYKLTNGQHSDQNYLLSVTLNPIQAYWQWRNR